MPFVTNSTQLVHWIPYNDGLEGFGDFKIRHVICNVKYADNLVLLDKDEAMLQGISERLTEIVRCYEMDINVEKTKVMRIFR